MSSKRNGRAKYGTILLKLSGEALQNSEKGLCIDPDICANIAERLGTVRSMGARIAIVIGGGNIFRGASGEGRGIDRTSGDYMGMLATMINALALQNALEHADMPTRVMTAIEMNEVLLWNAAIGGVVFGAVYALIGCSLNVLAGVLRVINFAHGEFIIGGSFFAYALLTAFELNPLLALPLCAVAFFVSGRAELFADEDLAMAEDFNAAIEYYLERPYLELDPEFQERAGIGMDESLPDLVWESADEVAEAGLTALAKGRARVVSGVCCGCRRHVVLRDDPPTGSDKSGLRPPHTPALRRRFGSRS